ncbi:protein bean1-like [Limosa lapponica baueri]|uniref:Protein bean1-like n=1 Tax=Limosa lapponica baueri TaxID=1758121 RepID=A0A2I0TNN7_LIMLA|nr:protein bean1-like [Limosa lapponica baueri]
MQSDLRCPSAVTPGQQALSQQWSKEVLASPGSSLVAQTELQSLDRPELAPHGNPTNCYDECVGPGATQIYIPTDDPPPYSLTDPCQRSEISINISLEEEAASGTTGQAANYAVRLQDLQQPISSISLSSLALEAAPLYETVVCEQNIPIPLVPMEVLKNSSTDYQTLLNQIM